MACLSRIRILSACVLLIGVVASRSAFADQVVAEAFVATGPRELPTDVLPPDTGKLYVLFKTHGVTAGDKFRAALIADHAGKIAPNSKVTEASSTLDGDTIDGGISFTRPQNGWPPGDYHVDIYINNRLVTTTKFKVAMPK